MTIRLLRVRRLFDWRFVVAFTVMMLAAYLVAGAYLSAARKDAQVDGLIRQSKAQTDLLAKARESSTAQRLALLRNQRLVLRQVERLEDRQAALLAYLRAQGVEVPQRYGGGVSFPANKNRAPRDDAGGPLPVPPAQKQARPCSSCTPPTSSPAPATPPKTPPPPSTAPAPVPSSPRSPVQDLLDGLTKGLPLP